MVLRKADLVCKEVLVVTVSFDVWVIVAMLFDKVLSTIQTAGTADSDDLMDDVLHFAGFGIDLDVLCELYGFEIDISDGPASFSKKRALRDASSGEDAPFGDVGHAAERCARRKEKKRVSTDLRFKRASTGQELERWDQSTT